MVCGGFLFGVVMVGGVVSIEVESRSELRMTKRELMEALESSSIGLDSAGISVGGRAWLPHGPPVPKPSGDKALSGTDPRATWPESALNKTRSKPQTSKHKTSG